MESKKRSPLLPLVVLLLLSLFTFMATEANAQVFCRSQFNLANEACSLRTFAGVNPAVPLRQLNESAMAAGAAGGGYEVQAEHRPRGGDGGHETDYEHEHERRHRHRRNVDVREDPYDTACCRRLMGIDNACICQAMSYLPVFMSRVKHAIKLTPVPGCDVAFECAAAY
uniref:Bifunctional inhibitor/plant lipid transfer protein/seed storage helical domain-containing protein n=1 Tax=Oryza brachyantha TaxID=4533 RepID=J3MWF5_ORYBR